MRYLLWLIPLALSAAEVNPQAYLKDVQYLASPEMKGRATGSPELEKAAAYLSGQFKSFGLKPADGKNFELAFPVTLGVHLGPDNSLRYRDPGEGSLVLEKDYVPFAFSSTGKLTAPVVFAGFGVTNKEKNYDDYAGIDVTGKFVLIFRHEPKETAKLSDHATFITKAVNAKMHGAKGVILINDTFAHQGKADELEKFRQAEGPSDVGILYLQMKESAAEALVAAAHTTLRDAFEKINSSLQPDSFDLPGVTLNAAVDVQHEVKTVHNVAAYLPGQTSEYVVIGAHYDHLGLGDEHSLAPSQIGHIHPGADDNASGTAGVVELARWFSKQPKPKRGILFLNFAGEELGLLGSEWYVNHPVLPLADAVAMINMDMIGRIRDGKVYLGGTGTGSTFNALLDEVKAPASLHVELSDKTGYGSSDHTSFTTKQVPVLFFFSGLHADYHKPSDTADKIDAGDAADSARLRSRSHPAS